jgi:hypothetical protein
LLIVLRLDCSGAEEKSGCCGVAVRPGGRSKTDVHHKPLARPETFAGAACKCGHQCAIAPVVLRSVSARHLVLGWVSIRGEVTVDLDEAILKSEAMWAFLSTIDMIRGGLQQRCGIFVSDC